jgi:AhpC/TSA family
MSPAGGWQDERPTDPEETKRATRPYSIVVGIAFLIIIGVTSLNLLENNSAGPAGLADGKKLPQFAAPAAIGPLDGDANVYQNRKQAGKDHVPACDVKEPGAIRICDYFDRPLVLTAWFSKCGGHCEPQLDRVERIRTRFPDVAFVGLDIKDSKEKSRKAVIENGWRFPMAVDRDGAVGALYSVGIGPTTFFAYPCGVLMGKAIGELDEPDLIGRVKGLVRASRKQPCVRASTTKKSSTTKE